MKVIRYAYRENVEEERKQLLGQIDKKEDEE